MIDTDAAGHLVGPSEADIRKHLSLEEEEELKRSRMPLPEGGTHVKYLCASLDLEESQ